MARLVASATYLLGSEYREGRRVRHSALDKFTGTAVSCSLGVPSARFCLWSLFYSLCGIYRAAPFELAALRNVGAQGSGVVGRVSPTAL